jgi:hypothetical protein
MESKFTINISKDGNHYFSVNCPDSKYSFDKVMEIKDDIKSKFEDCEVTVTRWSTVGNIVPS